MMQRATRALMTKDLALPVAPHALTLAIRSFDDPNVSIDALAYELAEDPVLTLRLLGTANSAYFGLLRPVETPREALRVLGLDKVRSLVMATAMRASFHHIPAAKLDAVWSVSLDAADIAFALAGLLDLDGTTAYTCGMLHAVGMLVMHSAMPEVMQEFDAREDLMARSRPRAERAAFGYSYAQAGALLLQRWRLPQRFSDAIEFQFESLTNDRHEPLAAVLAMAGWRARADFSGMDRAHMVTSYPDEVGLILNLDPDMMLGDIPGRGIRVSESVSSF